MHELKKMINERRKKLLKDKNKETEKEHEGDRGRVREKERHEREKESEKDKEKVENHKEQEQHNENQISREMVTDQEDKVNVQQEENGAIGGNHLLNGFGLHCLLSKYFCCLFGISCCII